MLQNKKYIYHYRSEKALLGEYQEIAKEEIHFSLPCKLNDCLEGKIQLTFNGDRILWTNFFRNYLFALHMLRGVLRINPTTVLTEKEVVIDFKPNLKKHIMTDCEYYIECEKEIFLNPVVGKLIDWLAKREDNVSEEEVSFFLRVLHELFCVIFAKKDIKYEISLDHNVDDFEQRVHVGLQKIEKIIDSWKDDKVDFVNALFGVSKVMVNDLLYRYLNQIGHNMQSNAYLLLDFPKIYMSKLPELMYPQNSVACFSKNCDDSSMWGYYADGGRGACLIFYPVEDGNCQYLQLKGESAGKFSNFEVRPVLYQDKRPAVSFFKNLGKLTLPEILNQWYCLKGEISPLFKEFRGTDEEEKTEWHKRHWEYFDNIAFVKHTDWQHEQEVRVVNTLNIGGNSSDIEDGGNLRYDFSSLHGVIFGIQTSEETKAKIRSILQDKCERYRVEKKHFYQANYNNNSGKIEIIGLL